MAILNPAIAQRPTAPAHYARALTYFYMGDRAASAQDLNIAIRAEPNNPAYRQLEQMMKQPINAALPKRVPNPDGQPANHHQPAGPWPGDLHRAAAAA
jgi:hypothetical protein